MFKETTSKPGDLGEWQTRKAKSKNHVSCKIFKSRNAQNTNKIRIKDTKKTKQAKKNKC